MSEQKATFQELVQYVGPTVPLPPERQATWNLIGQGKLVVDQQLQQCALGLQQILVGFDKMEAIALGKALEQYRRDHKAMIETRKGFTRYLDLAADQCMKLEREYDPKTNETYQLAAKLELNLREAAQKKVQEQNAKAQETANFNAHYKNEWYRLDMAYRTELNNIVHNAYIACLKSNTPVDRVDIAVRAAQSALNSAVPPVLVKMQRVLVNDAEAAQLFAAIPKPNFEAIHKEYSDKLIEKFSLYANDLEAAENVIPAEEIAFGKEAAEAQQQAAQQIAATTIAETASVSFIAPEGLKPITETTKIVLESKSEAWVVAIAASFLANFQRCFPFVRVKDYGNLNINQMAAALDAAGVKVNNPAVTYETVKK